MVTRPCGSLGGGDVLGNSSDVPCSSSDVAHNDDSDMSDDNLVSFTREGKPPVWTYFGFEARADIEGKRPDTVICCKCKKSVLEKGGNTYTVNCFHT